MDIDKLFESESLDGIADNVFGVVNNSVSEVKEMQRKKVAENVQLVVNALKKIESDISSRYDSVGNALEKRIITIKDGRDGADGRDGRNGKDGKNGRDGAPGPRGADGKNGLDGADGTDGVSVTNAHIDFDGSLVISLSSGHELNVGEVVAPALAEQIKVITNGGGTSQSVIDTLASLQAQITALGTAAAYKGLWNASTNTPTLTSSVGTSGNFYIVSVAGSTNLDGITNWGVGDWAIYNGTAWQRVEGGAAGNFTTVTASSLTSGRVTYAGTAGLLQDSANLLYSGTDLTVYGVKVGRGAGAVSTNTAVGASALAANAAGDTSAAFGYQALTTNTSGYQNTASGYRALRLNLSGINNSSFGFGALQTNSTSSANSAFGASCLSANTAASNSGFGSACLLTNSTGANNCGFGFSALNLNSSGSNNVAVGVSALEANTASNNTGIGYSSGSAITTGAKNVILGSYTGSAAPISATGSNYVVLSDGDGNIVASSKTAQTFALQGGTLSAGTGIAFPATQSASSDANTLDDYEEGTWTPADGSGAGLSLTTTKATYVKVGSQVTVQCYTTYPSTANASGAVISGLPFAAAANSYGTAAVSTGGAVAGPIIRVAAGGTTGVLFGGASTATAITNGTLSSQFVIFTGTYFV